MDDTRDIPPRRDGAATPARQAVRAALVIIAIGLLSALAVRGTPLLPSPPLPLTPPSTAPTSPPAMGPPPSSQPPAAEPTQSTTPGEPDDARCTRPPPQRLRVVSFNIRRAEGAAQALATIANEINALEADLVLLQEVDRFHPRSGGADQATVLAEALGMHRSFSANVVDGRQEYGTLILTRQPIVHDGRVLLPGRRAGREQRSLQWVQVDVSGVRVTVFNTHLEAVRTPVRVRQARRVLAVVAHHDGPAVVGGDLNSWPASGIVGDFATHLTDVWSVGEGPGATTPAGRRIDYVFVSEHFRADRAGTMTSAVSDHHRLWADVALRLPRTCTGGSSP